jgi:hypothetical protein
MFLFILFITLVSFLQATIMPVDLVSVFVLWILLAWPVPKSWITAWLAGFLIDLIIGRTLGLSSLLYLIVALALWFYQRKYQLFHPLFLFLYSGTSLIVINWLTMGQIIWKQAIVWSIFFIVAKRRLVDQQGDRYKLRL